jgi:hypothetical protein
MNRGFILLLLLFTGCSTISEYNQGCRDGIWAVRINGVGPLGSEKHRDEFCNGLDIQHRTKLALERGEK